MPWQLPGAKFAYLSCFLFIFGDTPSEIRMVLKNGVCRSSSEALFSAEPTFVDKKTSPNDPSNPNFPPLELRFGPLRAEFCDFRVCISFYFIVFSGQSPLGLEKYAFFEIALSLGNGAPSGRNEW